MPYINREESVRLACIPAHLGVLGMFPNAKRHMKVVKHAVRYEINLHIEAPHGQIVKREDSRVKCEVELPIADRRHQEPCNATG
eukprot:6196780-Pleurochrysis_carterae.AAC.1